MKEIKKNSKCQRKEFKFPNEKLVEQLGLVNEWWNALDPLFLKQIPKREMTKFLIKKGLIKKELEVDRFLKITLGHDAEIQDNTLKKSQFFKIFTKSILCGAISNLQHYTINNRSRIGFQDVPT
mmetsp:Transcript_31014/g.30475  ORF Transcript_31014/g.30475 Transcript_31014/m.30475 type:complete len:124 (+) Transcript_31014:530-901(+)